MAFLATFALVLSGQEPEVTDAQSVAAAPSAPTLAGPADGARLTSFGPTLSWSNPPGVTQYHLQVIPANNDGPGVDAHVGATGTSFQVPPPPQWYGLLPDMTYTWRVRVSNAATFVELNDPSWSSWAERKFRTPIVSSTTISLLAPANGFAVATLTPILQWSNRRGDVFYYEVQLSKDPSFNTDPATATAMVYSGLIHGAVTNPANSYVVPVSSPLEDGTMYSWRVRPRVQGDGVPVEWSQSRSFITTAGLPPSPWLVHVNTYRAMAKLPPVIENPSWNDGCWKHSRYIVKHGAISHTEDHTSPWYTPEGEKCGTSGNVHRRISSRGAPSDEVAIDSWMRGPFHSIGIVDPRLTQVAYGSYTEEMEGAWHMAATLDVIRGLGSRLTSTVYPIMWPADGMTTPLLAYTGGESPNPLTGCPDYAAPTGLPILLQLGPGSVTPSVTASSFRQGAAELEHCVFDETSYSNPDPGTQNLGRAVLGGRDTVVLIPRAPLIGGATYTLSITANGQTHTWSFSVS